MKLYKLSQRVLVRVHDYEWIDIYTDISEKYVRDYATQILEVRPDVELGLRVVTEEILDL